MLAIINGDVYTMAGPVIKGGRILIKDERILAVGGSELSIPSEAKVIDVREKVVMPGLIDAHCHLGIWEEIYQTEGDDINEGSDSVTPHLRAIDGVNPADIAFKDALRAGITAVYTGPGSGNVIGGLGLVMHTYGTVIDKMVLRNPAGLKVAFGENPKRFYSEQKKMPMTRMATAALLRENLVAARQYLNKRKNFSEFERDLKLEALSLVLEKKIPLRAHAHRADDIMTALRIAEEFGVDIVIEHCTEGHFIAKELAEKGVQAVVGPSLIAREKVELKERSFKTPGVLADYGLTVALMTDHPATPIQYLPLCGALAVKEGMSEEDALKAITVNSAKILGVEEEIGSLETGKLADIVISSKPILQLGATVEKVLVKGQVVYES
ncbi:MAG: amidohydrolase [Zhaonellaceae bacterium]|jgi:imidazolonepropionase-like amidohydrolase|nr:amidohydrolase [Clostridia bacterium]